MSETTPDASASIDIAAPPERVYALVSDPGTLAELAVEYQRHRWLGGATKAEVGARFVGSNKHTFRRWTTVCTITDADGKRFAFDVAGGPVKSARWAYDIAATADGCTVTESTWDQRPAWLRRSAVWVLGIKDRTAHNQANIEATLRALKERAERG